MANIPILDLSPEVKELRPQILEAINRVLDKTNFIMGDDVKLLEQEAAAY